MSSENFRMAAVVTTHGLNVHFMPGSAKILDAVPRGTKVTITAYEQRPKCLWAYVEIPSRAEFGWVWADFLAFDPPAAPAKPAELPRLEPLNVEPDPPVPYGAWLVLMLVAGMLIYAGASVVHFFMHDVPLPQ